MWKIRMPGKILQPPTAEGWQLLTCTGLVLCSLNFSFKCHRENPPNTRDITNVFSVNAISFHPTYGTFSTAGSDGTFHFW